VVDIDRCRNPETGEIDPWAREIIDAIGSKMVPVEVTITPPGAQVDVN
jgi:primase-polymerase (primpol)-like protein